MSTLDHILPSSGSALHCSASSLPHQSPPLAPGRPQNAASCRGHNEASLICSGAARRSRLWSELLSVRWSPGAARGRRTASGQQRVRSIPSHPANRHGHRQLETFYLDTALPETSSRPAVTAVTAYRSSYRCGMGTGGRAGPPRGAGAISFPQRTAGGVPNAPRR